MKNFAVVVTLAFLGFWMGAPLEAQDVTPPACEETCAAPAARSTPVGCATDDSCVAEPLNEVHLKQLVAHLKSLDDDDESVETLSLSPVAIEAELGFRLGQELLAAAIAKAWPEAVVLGGANRCSDFGACSLYGDLATATGEKLAFYTAEKEQDGRLFEDRELPAFKAQTLAGDDVESSQLRGQLTLLVPLAVHCSHSYDTLPILHELSHEYGPRGLRIVGLLVNSGSPEDATLSLTGSPACHDFWVTEGDAVGKLLGSRLVPGHLFVDADGKVVRQFVGFKDGHALRAAIEPLLDT